MSGLTRTQQAISVTLKGLIINTLLVVVKILFGMLGRSSAMIADGIHSLSDSVSDIFLLIGFRFVDRPADKSHNYGHGKIETLLSALISLVILFAGVYILFCGAKNIFSHYFGVSTLVRPTFIAVVAALISIVAKEFLYHITKTIGIKTNNDALIANAWHHRSDSLTSVGALLGIGGAAFLGDKWVVLDPLTAVLVAIFILSIGTRLLIKSLSELLETSLGEKKLQQIFGLISSVEGVLNPHKLRTRKVGSYIVIDVHIEVNRTLNIMQAHAIATKVENTIKESFGSETIVSVHIEPYSQIV
jgi:cation diffusion facilitator family transporter